MWTYWTLWSAFLYINGGLWVGRAMQDEPIYLRDGTWCKWCEIICVIFWPALMPIGWLLLLISAIKRNRTFV